MHLDRMTAMARLVAADHGVLATINRTGVPDVVPACFAVVGDVLAIPIDQVKPKRSTALGRLGNLERDPRATFLVERWDADDWSRLWWVRVKLLRVAVPPAEVAALEGALRGRYPQYAKTTFVELLAFRVEAIGGWEAAT